jgi:hypothetical protein
LVPRRPSGWETKPAGTALAAAGGTDASSVERFGYTSEADDTRRLDRAHDRQNIRGKLIGGGAVGRMGPAYGLGGVRVAELYALQFLLGECRLGALRYKGALLLGECCIEVEHEGISIGAQLRNDKRNPMRHSFWLAKLRVSISNDLARPILGACE